MLRRLRNRRDLFRHEVLEALDLGFAKEADVGLEELSLDARVAGKVAAGKEFCRHHIRVADRAQVLIVQISSPCGQGHFPELEHRPKGLQELVLGLVRHGFVCMMFLEPYFYHFNIHMERSTPPSRTNFSASSASAPWFASICSATLTP